jgi:oxygen-independent coproporphyrinogen-3 oxidase
MQTPEAFRRTIDQVAAIRPDRVAFYNWAYLPGKIAHQRKIDQATIPGAPVRFQILCDTHEAFSAAGYRYLGMDHFALPEDELARAFEARTLHRNFMGYTTKGGTDLVALGVTSISDVGGVYAQNAKEVPAYRDALAAGELAVERGIALTDEELLRRRLILDLMCFAEVDGRRLGAAFGIDFAEHFRSELEAMRDLERDGLVERMENGFRTTFLGMIFVRNIAAVFDPYLRRPSGNGPVTYSKTM